MCYTLSVLFCVLPPTKLRASDFLVSHGDRQLALPFPSNWPHLGPCTFNARCVQVRWTRWSTRSNYFRQTPQYAHVRYPDGKETTLATKYLGPKGHVEVVETLPTPERIPEEVGNLPLDTHVSVTPDAEPSSTPEPEPAPTPVQNAEPAPVRRSQRVRRSVATLDLERTGRMWCK